MPLRNPSHGGITGHLGNLGCINGQRLQNDAIELPGGQWCCAAVAAPWPTPSWARPRLCGCRPWQPRAPRTSLPVNQDVPKYVKCLQLVHLHAVALHVDYLLRAEPVPKQESTGFKNNFILKPLPINRSTGLDPPCGTVNSMAIRVCICVLYINISTYIEY